MRRQRSDLLDARQRSQATLLHRAEQRTDRAGDTHRQGTHISTRAAPRRMVPRPPRRERAKRGEEDERDDRDDENRLLRRKMPASSGTRPPV